MSLTEKVKPVDIDGLNDVYRDISELVGSENMLKIYEQYKGLQISFPTRLYNKDYVREVVRIEFNGKNAHELARRFGYSERWIKALAVEECKENSIIKDEGEN